MNQTTESPEIIELRGIPMLRASIPTPQMVIATVVLGLLMLAAVIVR
jgi:hypothetical protein